MKRQTIRAIWVASLSAIIGLNTMFSESTRGTLAQSSDAGLSIASNFAGRQVPPTDRIEMKLSRALTPVDGTVAVFFGETDITALLERGDDGITYVSGAALLTDGDNTITVYLVTPAGTWNKVSELPISIAATAAESPLPGGVAEIPETTVSAPGANERSFDFTPNMAINLKGQNQTLTFPREASPERNPFGEVDGQANIELKVTNRGWTLNNRFDFVGVGFQRNALRFGELQNNAPKIDLSSYLIELKKGRFSLKLGHVSFGSNRHLVNSFSSRGVSVTVPAGPQNEVTLLAANGTSIVGYDNFMGVTRRKHSVVGVTFAREFFKEHPGRLRFEVTAMRGSLLPLTNFNQREVNDAEKSLGAGFQVIGNLLQERLRYNAGFTRSRFHNPRDSNIEQGIELSPIAAVTRDARHAEISFDFIRGLKVWQDRKLKLTGTYRHEEIEPLFRSVVASTQADRRQNQFEISASLGDLSVVVGNLRDNDNLAEIVSILRSITRRNNVIVAIPLTSFFTPSKPNRFLPRLSYTFDRVHQFGAAFPNGGEFTSASHIPDQESISQAANAQWQLSEKLTVGYRYNRAFQDNKQPGRERADFESSVNGLSLSYAPFESLTFGLELSRELQRAFEQPRLDGTFRLGTQATWQTPFLKNSTLNMNVSSTIAGDAGKLNETRSAEFDVQWSYRFGVGKKKFRKAEAQFFIRYANRYGDAFDRLAILRSFTKTQGINAGITFNIF
jgi:hypothetical protein